MMKNQVSVREPSEGVMVIMLTAKKVKKTIDEIKPGSLIILHPETKKPFLLYTEDDELIVTDL